MKNANKINLYNFYEIFNDFNRVRILINLKDKEKSIADISLETGLNKTIVFSQLQFLILNNAIIENKNKKTTLYKIKNKNMIKIINDIVKYIEK